MATPSEKPGLRDSNELPWQHFNYHNLLPEAASRSGVTLLGEGSGTLVPGLDFAPRAFFPLLTLPCPFTVNHSHESNCILSLPSKS